ncbi:hypothetical protein [Dyella sp. 20L07]|uniref:hypothetical protein n=1 Tax=Dyella sp. 20L07 TaxID=3384240 RepID=UPI003D27C2CA
MNVNMGTDKSPIPVTIAGTTAAASTAAPTTSGSDSTGQTHVAVSGVTKSQGSAGSSDSDTSNMSVAVRTLLRLIAQLQKQLAREQQALHQAMAHNSGNDTASMAVIQGLQSAVTTTSGQLESAVNQLVTAMQADGSGSSGALVSASA